MADTGTFATTAEVQAKVGANASATYNAEAYINIYMYQAESRINVYCQYNFTDTYAALDNDIKCILKEAASNLAAIYVINADLSGFPTLLEAQTRIDVLRDHALACMDILKEKTDWVANNGST